MCTHPTVTDAVVSDPGDVGRNDGLNMCVNWLRYRNTREELQQVLTAREGTPRKGSVPPSLVANNSSMDFARMFSTCQSRPVSW